MKVRFHRLKLIERLIKERIISNQEQLQGLLEDEGLTVTQATLSRDLHSLKAYRAVEDNEQMRYLIPSQDQKEIDNETKADVARGILSVSHSSNLVVVKTPPNFAPIFGLAFERLALEEVLGVVAGFDTVLVVLKESSDINLFYEHIRQKVPNAKIKGTRSAVPT